MPDWTWDYILDLDDRLDEIVDGLKDRLDAVADGRVTPALDDLAIGSGRRMRAATLFFDIRGFSSLTSSADTATLKRTLFMLDCVLPMMMHVLHDHGAYIEKNTGDGLMAIIGAEETDAKAANEALSSATEMFYILSRTVNPKLQEYGIAPVDARIGIDLGTILLARIGVHSGTAKHPRNTLTAVGPSANLACKLQQSAGTNEIWCGDLVRRHAAQWRQSFFKDVTPPGWPWTYVDDPFNAYSIWHYDAEKQSPSD